MQNNEEQTKETLKQLDQLQNQQLRVDISQGEDVKCDSCNGEVFQESFVIKRLSPLISPSGKEMFVPILVYSCVKCGTMLTLTKKIEIDK